MPEDVLALDLLGQLEAPLLVSSVPAAGNGENTEEGERKDESGEEDAAWDRESSGGSGGAGDRLTCLDAPAARWYRNVDFVVDSGPRPTGGSTVFDMTGDEPLLLRLGLASPDLAF